MNPQIAQEEPGDAGKSPPGSGGAEHGARSHSGTGPGPGWEAGGTASDVVVREATAADAAALVELRALMFEAMGTPDDQLADGVWRAAAEAWFTERIGTEGVRVIVAVVDGRVAAAVVGEVTALIPGPSTPNGSVGLVSNVATLPEHRGRGLAQLVTDDLLRWFVSSTDVTRVDLFATPGGARIYEPRGFVRRAFPGMCLRVPRDPRVGVLQAPD